MSFLMQKKKKKNIGGLKIILKKYLLSLNRTSEIQIVSYFFLQSLLTDNLCVLNSYLLVKIFWE